MERVGVVGVSWRQGDLSALAPYTIPADDRERRLPELARELDVQGLVYLATCNRVEIAFAIPRGRRMAEYRRRVFRALRRRDPRPGEAERSLRAWAGEGAVEHLFLVASGLDSAKLGEPEINGQLRTAVDLSSRLGLCTGLLDKVFHAAFRVAKQVRQQTPLGRGHLSLAEISIAHAKDAFPAEGGALILLGVSEMTERCARALAPHCASTLVVSRTLETARTLACEIGADGLTLEAYRREPRAAHVIVSATGSTGFVLERAELETIFVPAGGPGGGSKNSTARPLLIDMAVPPDVDPAAARELGFRRLGMDDIIEEAKAQRQRREGDAAEARALIDDALDQFNHRSSERKLSQALKDLRESYEETAQEEVQRLLRRTFNHLSTEDQEKLAAWAATMARRFAHLPSQGLKALATDHGVNAVETFLGKPVEIEDDGVHVPRDVACDDDPWEEQLGSDLAGNDAVLR